MLREIDFLYCKIIRICYLPPWWSAFSWLYFIGVSAKTGYGKWQFWSKNTFSLARFLHWKKTPF